MANWNSICLTNISQVPSQRAFYFKNFHIGQEMNFRIRTCQRGSTGSMVIEAAVGYGLIMIIALLMLRASASVSTAQQWTVTQSMTDVYLTRESALGNRVPFADLTGGDSQWPTYPNVSESTVTIGKLPGAQPVTALLRRTKRPDENNLPETGGQGTETSNPGAMEGWKLQSFLVYRVGSREYVKSRTVFRVR